VLTPHPGEAARLLGEKSDAVTGDPIGAARRLTAETGAVVVLKGATTVVADPEGRVRVNPTGNAGLATGGTGDVLSGLLGGLLAQGCSPADAAALAVYLHGAAGDLAADRLTQWSLVAGDLLGILPEAFYLLAGGEEAKLWIHPL
jgi:NAD(P)H-hydrate epimerase